MSGNGKKFEWATKYYDRIVVMVVLLAAFASAIYLAFRAKMDYTEKALGSGMELHQTKKGVKPLDTAPWDAKQQQRDNPFQFSAVSNRTLVSELRVRCYNETCQQPIPFDAKDCPFCQQPQPSGPVRVDSDGDGIPDDMELMYSMDPYDPSDAKIDQDGDAYTAIEEFDLTKQHWICDPTDPAQYPPPHAKLRLFRVNVTPFFIQYKGTQKLADGLRFQLNLGGSSKFPKLKEEISVVTKDNVTNIYVVSAYDEIWTGEGSNRKDESVITLDSAGKQHKLVKNQSITSEDKEALMIFLLDQRPFKQRIGSEFDLKEYRYKVIDIEGDGVLIEVVGKPGEVYRVERITEEEIDALRKARQGTP